VNAAEREAEPQSEPAEPGFTLELTRGQRELVAKAHKFAANVIRPVAAEYDARQEFPWPVVEEAARQGFYDYQLYAGLIRDPTGLSLPLLMEELFWGCAGIGLSIVLPALALSAIARAATAEQLLRWAPECFGTPDDLKCAALAVTEPTGGSDVRAIATQARRDGGDWVIDGHKIFIGNGGIADVHVVVAAVDPDAGHRGQALFLVPKGTPGLVLVRKLDKLGCRASHTAELKFERCRVPDENLLGGWEKLQERIARGREQEAADQHSAKTAEEGGAPAPVRRSSATLSAFEATRPMVAAQAVGIARAAFEFARDYALDREAFGRPIIDYQGVAFPLADLAADIDAARLLTWRAAWMAANRLPFAQAEGSMSKLKASEVAVRATEQAIQTLGGWGYIKDFPVEKWYRDAKLYTIFEGTSEIQRLVIGRAIEESASRPPLHHSPVAGQTDEDD
jgi:acyl-CoA dehydrogenase